MTKYIANLLTLANLFCGTVAILFTMIGKMEYTALFVLFGILLDFLDGFIARLFKTSGELGKQLDSLADMVTSGVVPGIVMFQLMRLSLGQSLDDSWFKGYQYTNWFPLLGLTITLGACLRLAKFNIDSKQRDSFIGVPTPAICSLIVSIPLIIRYSSNFLQHIFINFYVLVAITFFSTYIMNTKVKMLALKFKTSSFKENYFKYILIVSGIILLFYFSFTAVPLIIILYIALSLFSQKFSKNKKL